MHNIHYHKFAADLQIYVAYNPATKGESERVQLLLKSRIEELRQWMLVNKCKLNAKKMEYIAFMSPFQLRKFGFFDVHVGDVTIFLVKSVHSLGAYMNIHNTATAQVDAICKK